MKKDHGLVVVEEDRDPEEMLLPSRAGKWDWDPSYLREDEESMQRQNNLLRGEIAELLEENGILRQRIARLLEDEETP